MAVNLHARAAVTTTSRINNLLHIESAQYNV